MNEEQRGMKRMMRTVIAAAIAGAIGGCSALVMGPEPSNHVGGGGQQRLMTDPDLQAVVPVVPGDLPGGAAMLPGATMQPMTMPSATMGAEGATTRGAETASGRNGESANDVAASQPGLGAVEVPAELSVQDAILVGLQNNTNLHVQKLSVPIDRTREEDARAAFDPNVTGSISAKRTSSGDRGKTSTITDSVHGDLSITENLPTGTKISAGITSDNGFYSDNSAKFDAGISVTQSLLRGFGLDVNLASLRQAELGTKITQYQLRGFAESLVATIEQTYWDLAFAERQVVIVQNALDVAQAQLNQTSTLIRVQRIAQSENAAAQAEVALRKEDLINAKSNLETVRLKLLQLITPAGKPFWKRTITVKTLPFIPTGQMDDVDKHVEVGLKFRPEMNETKLQIQQNDLEVVFTKNGLLPKLDFFVNLDKTGNATKFRESVTELNGGGYAVEAGLQGSWDPINRQERADYRRAVLTRQQTEESLRNLEQTVQVDVRTQYIEVERTRQQIDATRATRIAQEENFRVFSSKFRLGSVTSLAVAQVQRDLLAAQLNEVQAVTNHLKALVDLYRLEGSLLFRRGLVAPGASPVDGVAWRK